jgi:hypothetical protein
VIGHIVGPVVRVLWTPWRAATEPRSFLQEVWLAILLALCWVVVFTLVVTGALVWFSKARCLMRVSLCFIVTMLFAVVPWPLQAQTPAPAPIHRVTLLVIPMTGDPMTVPPVTCGATPCTRTTAISATSAACNQPLTVASPAPTNPTEAAENDPFNAGRDCRFPFPTGLPDGTFMIAAVHESDNCIIPPSTSPTPCTGPRSMVAGPFSVVSPRTAPPAPTGVRILAMLRETVRDLWGSRTRPAVSVTSGPRAFDNWRPMASPFR